MFYCEHGLKVTDKKIVKQLLTIEVRNKEHVVLRNAMKHVNPIKIFKKVRT